MGETPASPGNRRNKSATAACEPACAWIALHLHASPANRSKQTDDDPTRSGEQQDRPLAVTHRLVSRSISGFVGGSGGGFRQKKVELTQRRKGSETQRVEDENNFTC